MKPVTFVNMMLDLRLHDNTSIQRPKSSPPRAQRLEKQSKYGNCSDLRPDGISGA
jgi:hypothetical protein